MKRRRLRIEDYALIGDGRSAGLVGRNGSLDWLCCPGFDADPSCAALLGDASNGHWSIGPVEPARAAQHAYVDASMVLETTLECEHGVLTITDWMQFASQSPTLCRQIRCVRGSVEVRSGLLMRFDCGRALPWIRDREARVVITSGPDLVWLDSDLTFELQADGMLTASATLQAGEAAGCSLTWSKSYEPAPPPPSLETSLRATLHFWGTWGRRCTYEGEHREAVVRSFAVVKALTDRRTGGIVAAATSSLPERFGGERNWDYRYCWLRDASFTLLALANNGFAHEAGAWRDWLLRSTAGHPEEARILYRADGSTGSGERKCSWLAGYEASVPVRFGNDAVQQKQHDIFGELISALYVARRHGLGPDADTWNMECRIAEHVSHIWRLPDNGLWEMRDNCQHYTLSKAMCWVALDRVIRSAEELGRHAPVRRWRVTADAIHRDVCKHGFNGELNAFTQFYGSDRLDASLLLLALFGFLPADDPRISGTIDAIEQVLMRDGLVLRYLCDPAEGAFIACSLWLVQARVLQGRQDEAQELFDRVLTLRNDVGLLAEEFDTVSQRQCGNFPQTLSHVALINAARALSDAGYLKRHFYTSG